MASRRSLDGSTIDGRFRVVRLLGEGAMSEVYLANHDVLERSYVIKVLKRRLQGEAELVERFRREAVAASRLNHPNIVYISDFGQTEDGRPYLVMEYTAGEDLAKALVSIRPRLMPLPQALDIIAQVSDALSFAHDAGIIHRDIKPENVLLLPRPGGGMQAKVLDFGLAKIVVDTDLPQLTAKGEIFGTPAYMSPEQAMGDPVDTRTDIYSLGAMAFHVLTGRPPFLSASPVELLMAQVEHEPPLLSLVRPPHHPAVPGSIETLIMSCLAKDRDRRPTRAKELFKAIRRWQESDRDQSRASTMLFLVSPIPNKEDLEDIWSDDETTAVKDTQGRREELQPTNPTLESGASAMTEREWLWNQICKHAKTLAELVVSLNGGPPGLFKTIQELETAEEAVFEHETDIALLMSKLEEASSRHRLTEASLRNALVDLSLQRSDVDPGSHGAVKSTADLAYQIAELEKRLAVVFREHEAEQGDFEQKIADTKGALIAAFATQRDKETKLLKVLMSGKSSLKRADVLSVYQELEKLLKRWR